PSVQASNAEKPSAGSATADQTERIAQLRAEVKQLKAKGEQDALALQEAQKTVTQLSGKSKEDGQALAELAKQKQQAVGALAEAQKEMQQGALALEEEKKQKQQAVLALAGLQTSLTDFQNGVVQKLGQDIKQRIADLDKKALLQEETLAAL